MTPEHQVIQRIRDTQGTNDKIQQLVMYGNATKLRKLLLYTYDPYRRYHIKKFDKSFAGQGNKHINNDTFALLDQLRMRELTGGAAKVALKEHMRLLLPSEVDLLKQVIKKQLFLGISVKSINKAYPDFIPHYEVMKCEDWEPKHFVPGSYIGTKIDGVRGEFRHGDFYTRGGHIITGLGHVADYFKQIEPYANYDGELFIPGVDFHVASGIIRSHATEKPNVHFAVFDNLSIKQMPFSMRYETLEKNLPNYHKRKHDVPIGYIYHKVVQTVDDATEFFRACELNGFEGAVVKYPHSPYKFGRFWDWMRLTSRYAAEYLVEDVYEGEDGFEGTLGGVVITEGGVKLQVGSGFTAGERKAWWADPSLIIGKSATITYKELTPGGSLRQPVYKEMRWDLQ